MIQNSDYIDNQTIFGDLLTYEMRNPLLHLAVLRKVRPRATVAPILLTVVLIMFPSCILKLGGIAGLSSSFFPPFMYLYSLKCITCKGVPVSVFSISYQIICILFYCTKIIGAYNTANIMGWQYLKNVLFDDIIFT